MNGLETKYDVDKMITINIQYNNSCGREIIITRNRNPINNFLPRKEGCSPEFLFHWESISQPSIINSGQQVGINA